MIRQKKRLKAKQEQRVQNIVNDFLRRYNSEISTAKLAAKPEVREEQICHVNNVYLSVWRGVLSHVKENYEHVKLDPNYFGLKMLWQ